MNMNGKTLLSETEMNGVVGGWTGMISAEAEAYVGRDVWLVQTCKDGHENFSRVNILSATTKVNREGDSVLLKFEVIAKPGDPTESNMRLKSGEIELGDKWNIYLDY